MAIAKPARTFQDLLVWQKAHGFVLEAYAFTAAFPKPETYGLALQMRRAAVSIPANIAEGFRRRGKADKARFLNIAEGSVEECRYFLILAKDLGHGDAQKLSAALEEECLPGGPRHSVGGAGFHVARARRSRHRPAVRPAGPR